VQHAKDHSSNKSKANLDFFIAENEFGTMNPEIVSEYTINSHFFGLKLIPYSLHFRKHVLNFFK
jgi:hypothetical protein